MILRLSEGEDRLPLLARRGVSGTKKRSVSHLMAGDGVVVQDRKDLFVLNHHPVHPSWPGGAMSRFRQHRQLLVQSPVNPHSALQGPNWARKIETHRSEHLVPRPNCAGLHVRNRVECLLIPSEYATFACADIVLNMRLELRFSLLHTSC